MTEVKLFLSFLIKITVVAFTLFGVHYVVAIVTELTPFLQKVFEIHLFIYLLTIIGFGVLIMVGRKDFDKVGFAFAGLVLVKMILSFAFLFPNLKSPDIAANTFVFNFFAVYLLYLLFEVREAYILIQKGPFSSRQ